MKLCWEVMGSGVMCEGSPYKIASIIRGSTYGTMSYVEDIGHIVCLNYNSAFYLTVFHRWLLR